MTRYFFFLLFFVETGDYDNKAFSPGLTLKILWSRSLFLIKNEELKMTGQSEC